MPGIEREAVIFVMAVLAGVSVRLAYRCLECFRDVVKHSLIAIGIEDIVFWTGTALYLFVQIYQTSNGGIRWYFVLGVVVGAFFATVLVKKLKKLQEKICKSSIENPPKKR